MNELSDEYRKELPTEIEQIEEEVKLKFKEIVFDSNCCDWNWKTSTFDKHLIGKEKMVFLIEIEDNAEKGFKDIKIGGFLFEKIIEMSGAEKYRDNCWSDYLLLILTLIKYAKRGEEE